MSMKPTSKCRWSLNSSFLFNYRLLHPGSLTLAHTHTHTLAHGKKMPLISATHLQCYQTMFTPGKHDNKQALVKFPPSLDIFLTTLVGNGDKTINTSVFPSWPSRPILLAAHVCVCREHVGNMWGVTRSHGEKKHWVGRVQTTVTIL